jgi:predicted alpha/beta hydrolase
LATWALGYLPGRALRVGPDLPKGVYWQWRKWCTSRGFFVGDIGDALPYPDWNAISCPVRIVVAADDDLVPPKAVWRTMDFYRDAVITQKTLKPEAYGLGEIGHVGMFAEDARACWGDILGE